MRAPISPPVTDSATPSVQPRARSRESTACSIVSSSTPNTRSPRIARSSRSSASTNAARRVFGLALRGDANDETFDAAREERDRRVARSRRARRAGARPSRPAPTPTFPTSSTTATRSPTTSPDRRSRSGITCARTISCISYGTPGTAYTTLPSPTGQHRPGAVPIGFGSGSPPSGTSAWRRLFCGMSRRRVRNIVAMCSASSMRRTSGTPISSAIASRVRSSWVGPIPPQMSTASLRDEQVAQRLDDPRLVVADHPVLVGVDARRGELLADPGAVGVDDLAEQQLRTDRKNFASHDREPTLQLLRHTTGARELLRIGGGRRADDVVPRAPCAPRPNASSVRTASGSCT